MTRTARLHGIFIALWSFSLPGAAISQEGQEYTSRGEPVTSTEARDMAEDLLVLSSILLDEMRALYHHSGGEDGPGASLAAPLAEYLPGYGIVVQMRVPAPAVRKSATPAPDSTREVSRWERTLRTLRRGAAAEHFLDGQGCETCHDVGSRAEYEDMFRRFGLGAGHGHPVTESVPTRDALLDALRGLLSENGHNVRHLSPEERVSFSLSYPPSSGPGLAGNDPKDLLMAPIGLPAGHAGAGFPEQRSSGGGGAGGSSAAHPSNDALAGELLLRQGRFEEAIVAFRRALELEPEDRDVLRGLVRALHALGRFREAADSLGALLALVSDPTERGELLRRLHLDLFGLPLGAAAAEEWTQEDYYAAAAEALTGRPSTPQRRLRSWLGNPGTMNPIDRLVLEEWERTFGSNRTVSLPARLSISATKSQLAGVADGTLSPTVFARLVEVRVFDPTAPAASGEKRDPTAPVGPAIRSSWALTEIACSRDAEKQQVFLKIKGANAAPIGDHALATQIELHRKRDGEGEEFVRIHDERPRPDGTFEFADYDVRPGAVYTYKLVTIGGGPTPAPGGIADADAPGVRAESAALGPTPPVPADLDLRIQFVKLDQETGRASFFATVEHWDYEAGEAVGPTKGAEYEEGAILLGRYRFFPVDVGAQTVTVADKVLRRKTEFKAGRREAYSVECWPPVRP